MRKAIVLSALMAAFVVAFYAAPGRAGEIILGDDFEDGEADGWGAAGSGDVRVTSYAGNHSLNVTGGAIAVRKIDTSGWSSLAISAGIAADQLDASESCTIAVALDGNSAATPVGAVGDGQDDALTLHQIVAAIDGAPREVTILLAAEGGARSACWFDNITFRGKQVSGAAEPETPAPGLAEMSPPALARLPGTDATGTYTISFASSGSRVFIDDYAISAQAAWADLPALLVTLVADQGRLIPLLRGPVRSDNPNWELIVSPGQAWSLEGTPGGQTRISLPFALMERNANCIHYGLLRFDLPADGAPTQASFRIASETCAYFKFDLWGTASATRHSFDGDSEGLIAADRKLRSDMLPVFPAQSAPIAAVLADPADIPPADLTSFGLVLDGNHFRGPCMTRSGAYPFCDEMPLPSYSLAKSIVAGLALMVLEKRHPGASSALIRDYVPACSDAKWDGVTFAHALNMSTGNYESTIYDEDEAALGGTQFFLTEEHVEKIRIACSLYPHKTAPGAVFAYHTSDTYILGTAMQAYWRKIHGPAADIFDDLLANGVYASLGLSPLIRTTRRTRDDDAQPFTGWGLAMTADDIARLSLALQRGLPEIDGEMLHAATRPDGSGVAAGDPAFRYANGFWSWDASDALGCEDAFFVPYMAGFGGNIAALMPGGSVYYYFSDGYVFRWARVAAAVNQLTPMCPAAGETP